ncbi:MAG: ASKHA domain-containing protein, partial [Promethearchaeota archaeon]
MDSKKSNIIIDFEPISRRVIFSDDNSLYEILSDLNVPITSICGGLGSCGKCKILVQRGNEYLIAPTASEIKHLSRIELNNGWRLACQTKINVENNKLLETLQLPQFRVFLPNELLLEDFNILVSGISKKIDIQPAIQKLFIDVNKPSLEEQQADFERIKSTLYSKSLNFKKTDDIDIDFDVLNRIPILLRENQHKVTLVLWNDTKIISCEPGNTLEENFGIAFDIGTTTIVGYLINLNNGKIYAVDSKVNSQTAYGEDLITRLTYIQDDEKNLQKLNTMVLKDLNEIITSVCNKANIEPSQIYEATIVGNSVMHHIFLGLNPVNIGLSPFIPVIQKGLNIKASRLNLNILKTGNVYMSPLIAGFVGADTIGVILSSQIFNEKELTLAIDIGTNGEIIIGNRKILAVGSCAAGSALEGAHIGDGMRAAAGAIDKIEINPKDFDVSFSTIKNK